MTEDEIKNYLASEYDPSNIPESHPAYFASIKPHWRYLAISSILIRLLSNHDSSPESMSEWFKKEIDNWNKDFGDEKNRWLDLEKEYLKAPEAYPIILIQGEDGYYYLNDGHHRLAIALKHDLLFIPSIVALIE